MTLTRVDAAVVNRKKVPMMTNVEGSRKLWGRRRSRLGVAHPSERTYSRATRSPPLGCSSSTDGGILCAMRIAVGHERKNKLGKVDMIGRRIFTCLCRAKDDYILDRPRKADTNLGT